MEPYQFNVLGSTGVMTTNIATQVAAGTVTYIAAPTTPQNIIIYQIDWDSPIPTTKITIGDNVALENGGDRICFESKGLANGSRVFPNGYMCRTAKAVSAIFADSGDGVNAWVRISYTLS